MKKDELLPKDILDKLPRLGETSEEKDPVAVVKFFYPDFSWTWYGIEFDGKDIFYGYVKGFENEFGTFSLRELLENRGKLGCEIERDFYFSTSDKQNDWITLEDDGNTYSTGEITLYNVPDGNMQSRRISSEDFFK